MNILCLKNKRKIIARAILPFAIMYRWCYVHYRCAFRFYVNIHKNKSIHFIVDNITTAYHIRLVLWVGVSEHIIETFQSKINPL